jgi:hypothetical protein
MASCSGGVTLRLALRDIPVLVLVGALAAATIWTVLADLEAVPPNHEWIPVQTVFLAVLVVPLAAAWQLISGKPTGLFALLAPLVGLFIVANYYAFDVYGTPPYYRRSEAGDMPALAIYLGAFGALATGFLTWHRRRFGVVLTVPVCLGCAVLIFFSHVFH